MGDLTLQVREVDRVVVDDADAPDSGRRQVQHQRRPEAPRSDHQDAGLEQALLPDAAHLRQHDVAGVALDLVLGEIGAGHAVGCPVPVDPKPPPPRSVSDSCPTSSNRTGVNRWITSCATRAPRSMTCGSGPWLIRITATSPR